MTTTAATVLEPLDHVFDAGRQEEDAHTAWIRAELTRRMNAPGEYYPHEQVMAEMKAIIASKLERA